MVFIVIVWVGLIFVALTLPGALRRRGRGAVISDFANEDDDVSQQLNDVEANRPYWQKNPPITALARDRLEVLEMWGKNNSDPMNFPAPIPPAKPHPYFGDEHGPAAID